MSITSTLHFVPLNNPSWQPDADFLHKLCEYIGAGKVWFFSVFARKLDWEIDADEENESIFDLQDVPIEQVLGEIAKYRSLPSETRPAVFFSPSTPTNGERTSANPFSQSPMMSGVTFNPGILASLLARNA